MTFPLAQLLSWSPTKPGVPPRAGTMAVSCMQTTPAEKFQLSAVLTGPEKLEPLGPSAWAGAARATPARTSAVTEVIFFMPWATTVVNRGYGWITAM